MRFAHLAVPAFALATLAGCSDPVPPTPQGAWSVAMVNPDPLECLITSHNADVGSISVDKRDIIVVDGVDDAAVDCSVTGKGPFAVHGSASQNGNSLEILIDGMPKDASPDKPASGQAVFASVKTAGEGYQSLAPCNFYFQPDTQEGVEPGKIWVAFNCPEVVSGQSKCEIKQGYAIFENCTQDAED